MKDDSISGSLERLDGDAVRDVDDGDVVHLQDDVVHAQTLVDGSSAACQWTRKQLDIYS